MATGSILADSVSLLFCKLVTLGGISNSPSRLTSWNQKYCNLLKCRLRILVVIDHNSMTITSWLVFFYLKGFRNLLLKCTSLLWKVIIIIILIKIIYLLDIENQSLQLNLITTTTMMVWNLNAILSTVIHPSVGAENVYGGISIHDARREKYVWMAILDNEQLRNGGFVRVCV